MWKDFVSVIVMVILLSFVAAGLKSQGKFLVVLVNMQVRKDSGDAIIGNIWVH